MPKLSATQWKAIIVLVAGALAGVARVIWPEAPDFSHIIDVLAGILVGGALLPQPKGAAK